MERPLCVHAQIRPRGYSCPLQAAMTDFGAEVSFAQASARLRQHYGIEVPPSAVRLRTLHHGTQLQAWSPPPPRTTAVAPQLITELDGCLIPLREALTTNAAGGRTMPRQWKEVRLCAAWAQGQVSVRYGASLGSSVLEVGELWEQTAHAAGLGPPTRVHGVGDGAPWIAEQFDRHFGGQGRYLVDFYHVSEYLAAAALACAPRSTAAWLARQQARLKANQLDRVLRDLAAHVGSGGARAAVARSREESLTPVRDCVRYLQARREQLDYAGALAAGLPIGSGLIESGHRHVVQARLKKPGAWWYERHARAMLALRVTRANGDWTHYWQSLN